jgi:hypothetical protein
MPAARLKIPDGMTWEAIGKLFQKIERAQANARLLVADIENLRQSSQSELENWESFTKAVEQRLGPDEQISLAGALQKSISALLMQLGRFENQIPRRRNALEKLSDLTRQNLGQLSAFKRLRGHGTNPGKANIRTRAHLSQI